MAISTVFILYLKFLLPATATLFYELYHLLHIEPFYWLYSALAVVAVLFDQWRRIWRFSALAATQPVLLLEAQTADCRGGW